MPDIQIIAGGTPVPSTVLVSADQQTILGDGSAERPLHAASGGGIQFDSNRSSSGLFVPGSAAYQTATNNLSGLAKADDPDTALVTGLMISEDASQVGLTHPIVVQNSGPVVLTTAEWDAVTGGSGGLVANAPYYLSAATGGKLTTSVPGAGNYKTLVGVALNATTLLLQITAPIAV